MSILYRTPSLTPTDARVLTETDEMRESLRFRIRNTPAKRTADLRRTLTAQAIVASNTIEGYRVDAVDVADLIDGEREVDISEENKEETLAYQQTMTYVQTLHDVTDFCFSKGLLNALHWMLQGHKHPRATAGQWRRRGVWINVPGDAQAVDYEAPPHDQLPGLMGEFVDWLNEGDLNRHLLVRAAMAHLSLVKIHPWSDGNGRMSRTLQTLVIARGGILAPEYSSIEAWLGKPGNTWEYYKVLRQVGGPVWSPERDTQPWIRFNLLAYHQQTQSVQHRIKRSTECGERLADFAEGRGIAERQLTALHEAAVTGRVRRSRYQRAEALNSQQAIRDIQQLGRAGLLEAVGRTKGRYYVPGPEFPAAVLGAANRPHRLRDPYEAE